MNYSDNEKSVRVDFFKDSGKWYTTEAVVFPDDAFDSPSLHQALRSALVDHLKGRLSGMWAVCLFPYHEHEHPQMMRVP